MSATAARPRPASPARAGHRPAKENPVKKAKGKSTQPIADLAKPSLSESAASSVRGGVTQAPPEPDRLVTNKIMPSLPSLRKIGG